jgi:hypothetical protein
MADATSRHAFLNEQTVHNGIRPKTDTHTLDKVLTSYRELRDNDRIVTLNMIAAEVRRMESGSKDLSLSAILHQIYRHLRKYGVVRRIVTRVAQNTRYYEGINAGYFAFVKAGLKAGNYKASDIVNIGETNLNFHLFKYQPWLDVKRRQLGVQQKALRQGTRYFLASQWTGRSYHSTSF